MCVLGFQLIFQNPWGGTALDALFFALTCSFCVYFDSGSAFIFPFQPLDILSVCVGREGPAHFTQACVLFSAYYFILSVTVENFSSVEPIFSVNISLTFRHEILLLDLHADAL